MPSSSSLTERSLIDRMMPCGVVGVAEPLQGDGQMGLRLAVGQLQPVLAGLAQEVIDRFLVLGVDRPCPSGRSCGRTGTRRSWARGGSRPSCRASGSRGTARRSSASSRVQRLDGRGHVDVHAQVPQPAEAGGDVQRDVVVGRPAGEPRPGAVAQLLFRQLAQRRGPSRRSSRLSSNRMPTLRRAWLSAWACRTHGVSSSITAFRSWFFSSGLSSAGVPFHWSNTRRIFGSELAMCRASALAYSRLNVCSVHSCGNSIRYGSAITAYQDGLRDHLHRERSGAAACPTRRTASSLVNSNFFVCGPRIGSGSDSVTRIRRESTGRKPSSPSDSLPVEPTAL